MKKTNKKLMLSLSVLATPFVAENVMEKNVASANATYSLTQSAKVYTNAQNASKQVKSTKTYAKGTYYVYKQHNGMINISRTPGKPGAWINPATNKPVAAPTTKAVAQAPKASTSATPKAAATQTVKTTTQPVAKNTTPAPVAASKQTEVSKPQATATQTQATTAKKSNTYTLNNSVKTYTNAAAAKSQRGAKSTYKSGNYFIFKEFNGMMNISRVAGRAGAWINPLENKISAPVTSAKETKKVETTAKKPAEVKPVEQAKKETKPAEQVKTEEKTTQKPAEQTKKETKPAEQVKTEAKTTQKPTEQAKKETKPAEQVKTEAKTTQKPAEQAKKEETKQNVKPGEVFNLSGRTSVYSNAVAAASKSGSKTGYDQGKYYVYKVHNGMINISRTKGKAGAWINPDEIGQDVLKVLPFANKNYRITSPYGVARNIASIGVRDVHNGVDFVTTNSKEAILSTEDGVVTGSGYWPYDGSQYVTIKHSDNSYTSYWHLALNSITVKAGDKVKAGQKIGVIGSTGPSTGIHLHFMHSTTEKWWNTHQDPMKYLKSLSKK